MPGTTEEQKACNDAYHDALTTLWEALWQNVIDAQENPQIAKQNEDKALERFVRGLKLARRVQEIALASLA